MRGVNDISNAVDIIKFEFLFSEYRVGNGTIQNLNISRKALDKLIRMNLPYNCELNPLG